MRGDVNQSEDGLLRSHLFVVFHVGCHDGAAEGRPQIGVFQLISRGIHRRFQRSDVGPRAVALLSGPVNGRLAGCAGVLLENSLLPLVITLSAQDRSARFLELSLGLAQADVVIPRVDARQHLPFLHGIPHFYRKLGQRTANPKREIELLVGHGPSRKRPPLLAADFSHPHSRDRTNDLLRWRFFSIASREQNRRKQ